jgi:glycosyltransferase involved in cell wall biosynthesis
VTVVGLPAFRPRPISSAVFYVVGPIVAAATAIRRGATIVCQSPLEAVGVTAVLGLWPGRRPLVQVELHGDWRTAPRLYGHPVRRLLGPLSDPAAAWALRRADRVRVVSLRLDQLARDAGYDGPIDRFVTFSDFGAFLDRRPVDLPARPVALFAGVLERYKAVDVLLDAWPEVVARVPEARLVCVGDGSREREWHARAAEPALRRSVEIRSTVSRNELAVLMDASTCLVLPSRSEGLARIVLEAMARGRAVVASDVGGIREVLEDGKQGRIVPMEDAVALADALVEVLGDRARATEMGRAARAVTDARDPLAEYAAGITRMAEWIAGSADR